MISIEELLKSQFAVQTGKPKATHKTSPRAKAVNCTASFIPWFSQKGHQIFGALHDKYHL